MPVPTAPHVYRLESHRFPTLEQTAIVLVPTGVPVPPAGIFRALHWVKRRRLALGMGQLQGEQALVFNGGSDQWTEKAQS